MNTPDYSMIYLNSLLRQITQGNDEEITLTKEQLKAIEKQVSAIAFANAHKYRSNNVKITFEQ